MEEIKKGKKFAEKSSRPEIGASGTTNFQGIIDTDEYVTVLEGTQLYTTIDKMRWSDASVQAALLMCELPIRSAEWDIVAASDTPEDEEIADFVKENLFNGLVIPWEDTLRQILLMHPYGCMVFEVVYELKQDGKIGWRKWAPRLPKTIQRWYVNKNGELTGVQQRAYKDNNFIEVDILSEKLMVFVNRREGDNYLGTSLLRQAYKHWFFRDKYYKIDAVAQERLGIGIPVITLPVGYSDDDYNDAENVGKNLRGNEKSYVVKKTGWEVEMMDMKNNTLRSPMDMLEHHTREILKSVLAQFIDLGSTSKGSFALSQDQSQIFLSSLDASAKIIEDVINDEIKKLVDYNWTVEDYPKLTHSDLGIKNVQELSNAIQSLTMAGAITPDVGMEEYLRRVLKLPDIPEVIKDAKIEAETLKADMIKDPLTYKPVQENNNSNNPNDNKNPNQQKNQDEKPTNPDKEGQQHHEKRPLTKAEQRVRFDEINDYMDNAESEIIRQMLSLLKREEANLIPMFAEAVKNKDFSLLQKISWKLKGIYSGLFKEQITKLFEFGKLKASYEIMKPAPATSALVNQSITSKAYYLTARHEKQILDDLKQIAINGMVGGDVNVDKTIFDIKERMEQFYAKNVPATASYITTGEINEGRKYTFDAFKDEFYGYQWSSILDRHTCNYCTSMDGRVIGTEDKAFSEYKPGEVHFGCRCIWVAIMKEEVSPPPYTGIPDILVPQTEAEPWEFRDLEYPLVGSGGRRTLPYGLGIYKEQNAKK